MENQILRKLLTRTIAANFKQFISVILIIFLSFTLLSGLVVNSVSFDGTINKYFEETKLADLWLTAQPVSQEDETFFQQNDLVYSKRLYIETTAEIKDKNAQNSAKIYVYDGLIFDKDLHEGALSIPYVNAKGKVCYIDKNISNNKGVSIGLDELNFSLEYEVLGQALDLDFVFTIDGTMSFCECADTFTTWPIFISKEDFILQLNQKIEQKIEEMGISESFDGVSELPYNQVLFKTDDIEKVKHLLTDYYSQKGQNFMLFDRNQIESVVLLNDEVEQSKKMIYVFPAIFFVVALLVILTSINQLTIQEKYRIGLLKSLGIPDKKLLLHYSKIGAILCAIGAFFGLVTGPLLIPEIMNIKYYMVYSLPDDIYGLKVPVVELLGLFALTALLGFFVALFVCYDFLHKTPVQCLRQNFNIKIKHKNSKIISKKIPTTLKTSLRNLKIKPVRTIMATIGIAGCVALLLCGFGISDTLNYSVDVDLKQNFKYDIVTSYISSDFAQKLDEIEGVKSYELYQTKAVSLSKNESTKIVNLYNLPENSNIFAFSQINGETLVSSKYAKELGIRQGDHVTIFDGANEQERTITKIIDTSLLNGVFVTDGGIFMQGGHSSFAWICLDENVNAFTICEEINLINGTNSARTKQTDIENANNKISSIMTMTTTLKTFAILLAVVVLVNFIFLIIKERTVQFATLKVLGVSELHIWLNLLIEILFIGLFGTIIGMFWGYPLLLLTLSVNKVEVINYLFKINFASYFVSLLLVLMTIMFVSLVAVIGLRKINMIESLKTQE